MTDQLDNAWELRRAVHAWLGNHPNASMQQIASAHSAHNYHTIRNVIAYLSRHGCVAKSGKSTASRYSQRGAFTLDRNHSREKLSAAGRLTGAVNGRTYCAKPKTIVIPLPSAIYRNRPDLKRAIPNQRGQGAA